MDRKKLLVKPKFILHMKTKYLNLLIIFLSVSTITTTIICIKYYADTRISDQNSDRTWSQINSTQKAYLLYLEHEGRHAAKIDDLTPDYLAVGNRESSSEVPKDAWGTKLKLMTGSVVICSSGPDEIFGTRDDVIKIIKTSP